MTSVNFPIYPYLSCRFPDVAFHAKTQIFSFPGPKWFFGTLSFAFREGQFFIVFITVIFWFKEWILVFIVGVGPWFGTFTTATLVRFEGFGCLAWLIVVGWECCWLFVCSTLGFVVV